MAIKKQIKGKQKEKVKVKAKVGVEKKTGIKTETDTKTETKAKTKAKNKLKKKSEAVFKTTSQAATTIKPMIGKFIAMDKSRLRKIAEKALKSKQARAGEEADLATRIDADDIMKLVEELRGYQTELEIQNDQLKLAQKALEESGDKYVQLFDFAPVGYLTLDQHGLVLEANLTAAQMLGIGRRDLVGRPFALHVGEDERGAFFAYLKSVFETGAKQICEIKMKAKEDIFHARLEAVPVEDGGKEYSSFRMAVIDITGKIRLEEILRQSRQHFQFVIDAAPVAIAECDRDMHYKFVNESYARRYQMTREEILGRHVWEVLGKEAYKSIEGYIHSVLGGKGVEFEQEIPYMPIGKKWVHVAYVPELDRQGKVCGLLCAVMDITERKRAEEELRRQSLFLQKLMDAIPAPVFYKDSKGIYQGCNTAFQEYLGLEKDQIVGKTVYDVAPKELAEIYEKRDKELFERKGRQIYESSVKYADGTIHDVIFFKEAFPDESGLGGLIGVILDITERKKTEEALRQSHDELRRFNSIMVGRELRMIELKKEVNDLRARLGDELRYPLDFEKNEGGSQYGISGEEKK